MTTELPPPDSFGAYLLAARPKTLPAAAAPVIVGSACAFGAGGFALWPACVAFVCALLIQIGTNFANDLLDFEKGHDTGDRIGPARATQTGLLSKTRMRGATAIVFGAATLLGALLVARGGWPVALIGVASIVAGLAYTAGPYPLGYHGLGDLFVLVFFGFVAVCGTAFVQMGSVPASAWLSAIAVGALSTAILVVNNVRDRDNDLQTGKRTLAVTFGASFGRFEYIALVSVAHLVPFGLFVWVRPDPCLFLPAASAPLAVRAVRNFLRAQSGPAFNDVLGETGRLLLIYSLLLSGGFVCAALR